MNTIAVAATSSTVTALQFPADRERGVGHHRSTRPRTLHLVDLENLLDGRVETEAVTEIWREYRQVTGMGSDDHVVVAVAKRNAAAAFFGLPQSVQRIIGDNGPDGADLALLDAVDIDWSAKRFGQVMVSPGDHIFTGTARGMKAAGMQVVQVIGGGTSSTALYLQCSRQLNLVAAQHRARALRSAALKAETAA
ncbi:NYN domain-containing protein [Rhodococcus sp. DN22]|uniref:NYN domain-containing protein n=1 Tax=Rhodococcus sp. DN22 TaxID=357684 RepID=UPI0030D58D67